MRDPPDRVNGPWLCRAPRSQCLMVRLSSTWASRAWISGASFRSGCRPRNSASPDGGDGLGPPVSVQTGIAAEGNA